MQVGGEEGDAPHRDPAGERLIEGGARGAPQFHIQCACHQAHAPLDRGVVGVAHGEPESAGSVAALAEPPTESLGEGAEDAAELALVVGVGDELVRHAAFVPDGGR